MICAIAGLSESITKTATLCSVEDGAYIGSLRFQAAPLFR